MVEGDLVFGPKRAPHAVVDVGASLAGHRPIRPETLGKRPVQGEAVEERLAVASRSSKPEPQETGRRPLRLRYVAPAPEQTISAGETRWNRQAAARRTAFANDPTDHTLASYLKS